MKNIAKSLARFHEEMGNVAKDASNPFFKSKYAPLETILPAIKEPLKNAGLVFTQVPTWLSSEKEMIPALNTRIIDIESAEEISGTVPLILAKQDPQGVGSAITYMRRYALVSMLGLNCDEDDDGNSASEVKTDVNFARKNAETDIIKAESIEQVNDIQSKIKKSKILTAKDKEELSFIASEKRESFDPTK